MHDSAACVTVNAWPATVSVAVRAAPVLAAAVIVKLPGVLPLAASFAGACSLVIECQQSVIQWVAGMDER